MQQDTISYEADGLQMRGQLFFEPNGGARPGVLVFPEAFGLGEHAISRAERLAGMGYAALACDLHGDGKMIEDLQEAIGQIKPLMEAPERTRTRAGAALDLLSSRPEVDADRIAAIGFCFGGTMALELARGGRHLAAVVGFHSGLATQAKARPGGVRPRVLVCIGGDDPMIPPEQRREFEEEMRAAGADWQLHVYGNTVHSFTNRHAAKRNMPDAIRYSPEADHRSWASMTELFQEALK